MPVFYLLTIPLANQIIPACVYYYKPPMTNIIENPIFPLQSLLPEGAFPASQPFETFVTVDDLALVQEYLVPHFQEGHLHTNQEGTELVLYDRVTALIGA